MAPLLATLLFLLAMPALAVVPGAYPMAEASFDLPQVRGNPFDFTQNDVAVVFADPDGRETSRAAFFDGGRTWRVRRTPAAPGLYRILRVTLNGRAVEARGLRPASFNVGGSPGRGFVRLSPSDGRRFVLSDGTAYYPLGFDLAWRNKGEAPLAETLAAMGRAGADWTRIWMCHWGGTNLDWTQDALKRPALGELNLTVAAAWDKIVAAAESSGVRIQLVLQHHGQYSTKTDPNWSVNPWNKANGGWLDRPEQFFSDPRAIALTKSKYRYIAARWGYSPAILAWELFNEVEWTDGYLKDFPAVAAWHAEMARFLRAQDPDRHLITTSSEMNPPELWTGLDYYSPHVYPAALSGVGLIDDGGLDRPYFYGEFGLDEDARRPNGETLQRGLWASLMSRSAGAAQYWFWDAVEAKGLLPKFSAARKFLAASGLMDERDMKPLGIVAETRELGPLMFAPGRTTPPARPTEYALRRDGSVAGLPGFAAFPSDPSKQARPTVTLDTDYPADGTFAVRVNEKALHGARLEVSLDGHPAAALDLAPTTTLPDDVDEEPAADRAPRPDTTLTFPVPAGAHSIVLRSAGKDWARVREFTLTPYAPELGVFAKGNGDLTVLWVYNRVPGNGPISGTLHVPGLAAGSYHVAWMDTDTGNAISEERLSATGTGSLALVAPPIARDAAAWLRREK